MGRRLRRFRHQRAAPPPPTTARAVTVVHVKPLGGAACTTVTASGDPRSYRKRQTPRWGGVYDGSDGPAGQAPPTPHTPFHHNHHKNNHQQPIQQPKHNQHQKTQSTSTPSPLPPPHTPRTSRTAAALPRAAVRERAEPPPLHEGGGRCSGLGAGGRLLRSKPVRKRSHGQSSRGGSGRGRGASPPASQLILMHRRYQSLLLPFHLPSQCAAV